MIPNHVAHTGTGIVTIEGNPQGTAHTVWGFLGRVSDAAYSHRDTLMDQQLGVVMTRRDL
jgi:hypothetical protein